MHRNSKSYGKNRIRVTAVMLVVIMIIATALFVVPGVLSSPLSLTSYAAGSEDAEKTAASDESGDSVQSSQDADQSEDGTGQDKIGLAVDPVKHSENTTAVLYNNTNGLPTSEANAIVETSEGFIYIGSYGGLVRYDGNTFHRMDSTTGIGSVVSLFVDSKDRLWIGTNESGLALMVKSSYNFWGKRDGFAGTKVTCISEDDNGVIYAGTNSGISMLSPEMNLSSVTDKRVMGSYIEHIRKGADGLMYVTTSEDDCFTLRDGEVVDYIAHEDTRIRDVTNMLPDPDEPGKIYAGTGESMLYHTDISLDPEKSEAIDISPLVSVIELEEIDDKLWICARNGIGMIDDTGFHHLSNLPMDNSVTDVMADYEGDLWFVSTRQGVMKLVPNRFFNIFERFGLNEAVVNSTCVLGGRMYVGTDDGLIVLDDDRTVTELPLTQAVTASGQDTGARDLIQMFEDNRIRSVIKDSKDRLWISTWRGVGLVCYDKRGTATVYTEADGLLSGHIRAVHETADGSILVAVTGGLNIIRDGKVTESYGKEDGIINTETLTVCSAPNGDILLGSNGDGIYVFNGKLIKHLTGGDGLSSDTVMRIKYDADRHLFWLVTSNSIAYMTEDYKINTVRNFPYSNNFDMYENSKGDMWILSSNGIYVTETEELLANKDIDPVHYSIANGLPCTVTSNSYSALTDEGNLYIAGNTGIARVNINESMEDVDDLKQAVPFILADGKFYFPDTKGAFELPSGVQRVTIYAYVYNYSLTDPQVTYNLEGFDRRPVTVSRSDLGAVTYTNLSGGTYRFNMELHDAMGRGSKTLSVAIEKEKAIYEQTWFYLLVGSVLVLSLFVGVMSYVGMKLKDIEAKHREEAEKERIAGELTMASRIQLAMLPSSFPAFPDRDEFDIYALMQPAREVGGDFYDFFLIDDDHLCLIMADVSGKGVPASLYMMISKVILEIYADSGNSAGEILEKTNNRLSANNASDMFVTVWLGILEISTGRMTAANAGHEYPVIRKEGGKYELLKDKHSIIIGGIEDVVYGEYGIDMSPGDSLFLYTDGVPEATNRNKEMFGTGRMIDALNENADADPKEMLYNVRHAVSAFVDKEEQFDDLTMLCLEYRGPQEKGREGAEAESSKSE